MRVHYHDIVSEMMAIKTTDLPVHQEWLRFGLLHCAGVMPDELARALDTAQAALGQDGTRVATCYIEYDPMNPVKQPFIGVAAYKDEDGQLVVDACPVRVLANTMMCNGKSLGLAEGGPGLFITTCWLARAVFGLPVTLKPVPLLTTTLACGGGGGDGNLLCLALERPITLDNALRQLDVAVWAQVAESGAEPLLATMNAADILHCYGLVYVGSLHEMGSTEEAEGLRAIVQDGSAFAYWLEDATVFEDDAYNLIMRFQTGEKHDKAFYFSRRLTLTPDGMRFQDTHSKRLSPALCMEEHRPPHTGISAFSEWVQSLLAPDYHRRPVPYLRSEVLAGFLRRIYPSEDLRTRPFLVDGRKGDASALVAASRSTWLPPRLLFSPDLFFARTRIPKGTKPVTVQFTITFVPWTDDPDLQLFLKVEGHRSHIYKVVFPDKTSGERMPPAGQLRTFITGAGKDQLDKDGLGLSVVRPTRRRHWDSDAVEFTLTTHHRAFSICTDTLLCDFAVAVTMFPYDATTPPTVFPEVHVPLFTTEAHKLQLKLGCTLDRAIGLLVSKHRHKRVCTSLFEAKALQDKYLFFFWDGHEFQILTQSPPQ